MSQNPVRSALLSWFAGSARDLPWRADYDPYRVWVSEIMLQQTQMDRAVAYFTRFIARYPDVYALAEADPDELNKLWEGLGYYARAKNLHAAAKIVADRHGGRLPETAEGLRELPGIGAYASGAIASIAFGESVPALDANAVRVLARIYDVDAPVASKAARDRFHELAAALISGGDARALNQALMELGALICLPKNPRCSECPAAEPCQARYLDIVSDRPVKNPAKAITPLTVASGLLVHDGRIFVQKRPDPGVWAGLWEFPGGMVEPGETPEQAVVREFAEETEMRVRVKTMLDVIKHGYTTYRVSLHCFALAPAEAKPKPVLHAATDYRFAALDDLDGLAFPAGHRKLIDRLSAEPSLRVKLGID